jgi:predicted ATP-grasp superfamily ATP-dependent carboligase
VGDMKKVIVMGGGAAALGVSRALALKDIEVIFLSTRPNDFARFTKFATRSIKAPSPINNSNELLELLMDTKEDWDGALLIPTIDSCVVFISQNREILSRRYIPAVQEWSIIKKIIDKGSLYRQAQQIGVPTPRILFPESNPSSIPRQGDISYPCILKPHQTTRFYSIFKKKVLIIKNYDDLVRLLPEVRHNNIDVMVSEIIPGPDHNLFHYRSFLDREGNVLAEMCTQKLRQHPPVFGQASASRTIPMIQEIRSYALKLLRSFSYHGVSSTEFKFDVRDNKYKLMEINNRPVLPERHFLAAGINFPYITYLDFVENVKIPKPDYKTEIYWIHNFFEIREFWRGLRSRNLNFRDFLEPYRKREKVFAVPLFDDPLPFLASGPKIISRLLGNLL